MKIVNENLFVGPKRAGTKFDLIGELNLAWLLRHFRGSARKSDSKFSALNRKIDTVSRSRIGFLSFRYHFEALIGCGFNFEVL